MGRLVREWVTSPAIFIDLEARVSHAMTLMRRRGIHSLIIDFGKIEYGILTTTDIRDKIVGAAKNPQETKVKDIISSPVLTAKPEWDIRECSLKMQEANVHHLPVLKGHKGIVGMISAMDIFPTAEEIGWED